MFSGQNTTSPESRVPPRRSQGDYSRFADCSVKMPCLCVALGWSAQWLSGSASRLCYHTRKTALPTANVEPEERTLLEKNRLAGDPFQIPCVFWGDFPFKEMSHVSCCSSLRLMSRYKAGVVADPLSLVAWTCFPSRQATTAFSEFSQPLAHNLTLPRSSCRPLEGSRGGVFSSGIESPSVEARRDTLAVPMFAWRVHA